MRVLETRPAARPFAIAMGKRKHKLHKKGNNADALASDSSDEGTGSKCPHVSKALNFSALKKCLKQHGSLGECKECESGVSGRAPASPITGVAGGAEATDPTAVITTTVWLCMQCGNQGCDRNSRHKHALSHYKTPRSSSHALVLNLSTWGLWCYDCDEEVMLEGNKKLVEALEFVRKMAGLPSSTGKSLSRMDSKEMDVEAESVDSNSTNRAKPSNALLPKVKGLSNLGNTCFFNAVMQNLSQTAVLESVLIERSKVSTLQLPGHTRSLSDSEEETDTTADDPDNDERKTPDLPAISITLPDRGGLTQSLLSFLKDMHSTGKNSIISPSSLFGQVCRKAPRFKGFQQQDSHELLRHLLDGMKTEEITRARSGILKKFEISESTKTAKLNDDLKMKVKEYGRQGKHTFVDDVFGGYFISTVLCEECQVPSQMLEPFLDVSLPITEEKTIRPANLWSSRGKKDHGGHKAASPAPLALEEEDLDGADSMLAASSAGGVSKHMSKKMKKQARKEAKRKGKANEDEKATDGAKGKEETKTAAAEEDGSDDNLSDADIEDNLESDVSRTQTLQRSASAAESMNGSDTSRKNNDASPEGSASNTEFSSLGSEDTTLVEDSSSTINGDKDVQNSGSPELNQTSQSGKSTAGNKLTNGDIGMVQSDSVRSLSDAIQTMKLIDDHTEEHLCNGTVEHSSNNSSRASSGKQQHHHHHHHHHNHHHHQQKQQQQQQQHQRHEMCRRAMSTLASRYQPVSHECSVQSCLHQFTSSELLTGNNKFGCENCSRNKQRKDGGKREMVYCNASKQLLIFSPPLILTLHLKRFSQVGFSLRKVSRKVEFPNVLDLAPYCSALCQGVKAGQTKVLYSLYGIVEHSGRLTGGHYTAHVKVRSESDQTRVSHFLQTGCRIQGQKLHKVLQELDHLHHKKQAPNDTNDDDEVLNPEHDDPVPPPPPPGRWFYISDSKVAEVSNEGNIFNREAYLLFYERLF